MIVISFQQTGKDYKIGFREKRPRSLTSPWISTRRGLWFSRAKWRREVNSNKILLNLIFPSHGKAEMLGKDVGNKDIRKFVGYLPENPYFYDYLNPIELLHFSGKTSGMNAGEIEERTIELLNTVGLWNERKGYSKLF